MNNDWNSFLQQNNELPETSNQVTEFPDCARMNLSQLGVLKISGEDKIDFLQGQLTNDSKNLSTESSQLSSYCSPKGRMLASFRLFQRENDIFMIIPVQTLESTLKRLRMFILRSQVVIEDVSDHFAVTGLYGDCLGQLFTDGLPEMADDVSHKDDVSYIRIHDSQPRYLAIAPTNAMQQLWQQTHNMQIMSSDYWRLLDIRSGLPNVQEKTVEAFIPQMTNMQLINGVSFTKGCYTGQEVVARMQYLGKLKRRMYQVEFDSDSLFEVGDDVFSNASQSGQGAGKLVDVINTGDQHFEALAVIEINALDGAELRLKDQNGPLLKVSNPPYEFEQN